MIHFILTRFNLKLWPKDKNGSRIEREAWLDERMELFEKYCYPSVKRQSCQDFRWILMLDDTTSPEVVDRLNELREDLPQMELLEVPEWYARSYAELFRRFVLKESEGEEKVLTTYLDNDDAISTDYVKIVQHEAESCANRTALTFDHGYQYFTGMQIATIIEYPNNHFITLVEPRENMRGVYGMGSHYYLRDSFSLYVKYLAGCNWVEVVHSDNVDNDVKMTLNTFLETDTQEFRENFGDGFTFSDNCRLKFAFKWMPRALGQFVRRLRYKIKPRDWWGE